MLCSYNYRRFRVDHHPMDEFPGPAPGEPALDFRAHTLDGREVRLSDFEGQILVLETGSFTCPHYVGNIDPMHDLAFEFPEALFLMLYVREAHPGGRVGPHQSFDDKLRNAHRLRDEEEENRMVLVDDLDGRAHQAYGAMPNMAYVINEEGRVVHRSEWANAASVRRVLEDLRHQKPLIATEEHGFSIRKRKVLPTLYRAGLGSIVDFLVEFPKMALFHLRRTWTT